jgi:uncharacterized protein (TIGR02266 family)
MTEPVTLRLPFVVQAEFRTAASFLVAYSVNLSRGALFLETEHDVPSGSPIGVDLGVPGVTMPIELAGIVAWRRGIDSPEGPPGIGIELADIGPLGPPIDQLVAHFHGIQVLLLSGDRQDRTTLARLIKSIVTTAEVAQAADAEVAKTALAPELDLVVLDIDFETERALDTLRTARALEPRVPIVAITANAMLREQARAEGADETASNPPPFTELQVVLVRALSRPLTTRVLVSATMSSLLSPSSQPPPS